MTGVQTCALPIYRPFIDTFLSGLYNKTVGFLTGDRPWDFHYFPEEMRASYGPFGILVLFSIYRSFFAGLKNFKIWASEARQEQIREETVGKSGIGLPIVHPTDGAVGNRFIHRRTRD